MIPRILEKIIREKRNGGKAIFVIGPRQVGKTTLIHTILDKEKFQFLNGDDPTVRSYLIKQI